MWQPVVHQITVNWDYHVCQLVSLSQGRIVFANFVSHFWVAVRFRICGTVAAILTSVQPILTVQANLASLFKPMLIVLASLYTTKLQAHNQFTALAPHRQPLVLVKSSQFPKKKIVALTVKKERKAG